MSVPPEIQHMIISFIPHSSLLTVCKEWNSEIKNIQKKSVDKIGRWYKKNILHLTDDHLYNSVYDYVRCRVLYYPNEIFIGYPEYIVISLALPPQLLEVDVIPPPHIRTRKDVRNWLINMPFDLSVWEFLSRIV